MPKPPDDRQKKKKDRFEVRAEKAWLARVKKQARRYGMSTAAYIRQAVQLKLESDEGLEGRPGE